MIHNEPECYPYVVSDFSAEDALIVAPHPDDESLGCGGGIVKHVKAGSRVKVIFLTDGDKGDFANKFGKDYVNIRRQSAKDAMEVLGVKDYEFWGYGDRDLYSELQNVSGRLMRTFESYSPSVIYSPSPLEAHPDHRSAFEAVWNCFRDIRVGLIFYEILMAVYPNVLLDITGEMQQKKRAIESYFTEVYYNDYVTKIEGLNRFRTATLPRDIHFAEAYVYRDSHASIAGGRVMDHFLGYRSMGFTPQAPD